MALTAITREVSSSINGCELSFHARQPIDLAKAIAQHKAYRDCLAELGVRIVSLPAEPELPDAVFVEDPAVVVDERGARPNDSQSVLTLEPDPSVRAGDALVVGVRSADVTLAPRESVAADLPNRVGGVVREVNYRGAASLYRVATPLAGQPLIATSDADFAIGAELDVCIAPASLMRLAAGGG